ncbi:MAG: 4-hydroxy-tetrahydrodipicolinate synthase [Solirubrobacterales bacterium]
MARLSGVITAMVTPFTENGAVDIEAARRLSAHLVDRGSDGLVVAGTTGESPTLSDSEKIELLEAILDEVGDRATVIAGTGSNDTRHSAELTRRASAAGAAAVLIVTPYYNKPSRAGLRAHVGAIADAAGETPIVLYNIPSRCVINMPPDLLAELAAEIPNVVAVKQANDDDLGPIEGLDLLAGNDDSFLRTLELGGTGGILVASHVIGPEMAAVYEAHAGGDLAGARELDEELKPVYEAMAVTSNPTPVKTALEMLGVIDARFRLPMVPASRGERDAIRGALERRGLLVAGGAN